MTTVVHYHYRCIVDGEAASAGKRGVTASRPTRPDGGGGGDGMIVFNTWPASPFSATDDDDDDAALAVPSCRQSPTHRQGTRARLVLSPSVRPSVRTPSSPSVVTRSASPSGPTTVFRTRPPRSNSISTQQQHKYYYYFVSFVRPFYRQSVRLIIILSKK